MSSDGAYGPSDLFDGVLDEAEPAQEGDTGEGRSSPNAMRSSPPVEGVEVEISEETPRPGKKRSREEMDVEPEDGTFPSSATMVGDEQPPLKDSDQTEESKPKAVANNMAPPPLRPSGMQQSFRTPPSAQPPQKPQAKQLQRTTSKPEESKRLPSRERPKTPENDDSDSPLDDPEDRIADFDWTDLRQRYHDRMTELNQEEEKALNEFHKLCEVRDIIVKAAQMLTPI